MAFTKIMTVPRWGISFYYSVNYSVGGGGKNVTDDVMLVQYFLRRIYRDDPVLAPILKNPNFVNGVCGLTTRNLIFHFQRACASSGNPVALDGLIDKPKAEPVSTISKTVYTIILLNLSFKSREPYLWAVLPAAPDLPPILKAKLAIPATV